MDFYDSRSCLGKGVINAAQIHYITALLRNLKNEETLSKQTTSQDATPAHILNN